MFIYIDKILSIDFTLLYVFVVISPALDSLIIFSPGFEIMVWLLIAYTKQAIKLTQATGVRLWDRNYLAELINNYDDDDETESPDFDNTISIPEKNLIKTETKCGKIQLEKGIYLENDKIHIGHDSYSFIGADKLRVFVLWSIWIILICSTLLFSFQPIIGIIGIIGGIYLISYYKRIKNALDNYLRIRIKSKERQPQTKSVR